MGGLGIGLLAVQVKHPGNSGASSDPGGLYSARSPPGSTATQHLEEAHDGLDHIVGGMLTDPTPDANLLNAVSSTAPSFRVPAHLNPRCRHVFQNVGPY